MAPFLRQPRHRYDDPLARIWIACAERVGFRIARTRQAYASTDGRGTIFIGEDELLDPDDSLAQMILHELCHALVEGEEGERQVDWGLDNTSGKHTWREQSALRLQAFLTGAYGLREFFAPTTDFRVKFWNDLPRDPFQAPAKDGGRREPSCVAARIAVWRAGQPRWARPLAEALAASATIAALIPAKLHADDTARSYGVPALPSLWSTVIRAPATHPAGHAPVADDHPERSCSGCAWTYVQRRVRRCRMVPQARLFDDAPSCVRWEPAEELDCHTCAACCREAYQSVEVIPNEPVIKHHPEWVLKLEGYSKLLREGDRCVALRGGRTPSESYACAIYGIRPRTCREFVRGGAHCLDARRRVGLSL